MIKKLFFILTFANYVIYTVMMEIIAIYSIIFLDYQRGNIALGMFIPWAILTLLLLFSFLKVIDD